MSVTFELFCLRLFRVFKHFHIRLFMRSGRLKRYEALLSTYGMR